MRIVNVIGSGFSGLYLAINLARRGIKSNLFSQMPSERSQSVLAEGGINVALNTMGEDDNKLNHFNDTLKGGDYLENEENIWQLINNSFNVVNDLINLGVPFNRENNQLVLRNFGGQKKKRTAFSKTSTGKMIMTSLIDEARKYEMKGIINRYSHHQCVDMEIENNKLKYIVIKDEYSNEFMKFSGTCVLAIGGLNGMFDKNYTGSALNNANLQAILFSKGLKMKNLEMIQYHPTTINIGVKRLLVSEAARGEGGRLFVFDKFNNKYYFMEDKYPELKNLMPRDVVSREEYYMINDSNYKNEIYLDMTSINIKTWKNKLSDLRDEIIKYTNLDPIKEYIPITPGIHYFMGGIDVDINHKTNIDSLYAIGECASIYHGANRLGGNSILGALVGGYVVGNNLALEDIENNEFDVINYNKRLLNKYKNKELVDILINSLGIVRDEKILKDGLKKLDELKEIDIEHLNLAKAFILSALNRCECRGAHYRNDYQIKNDKPKQTIASFDKDVIITNR